MAVSDESPRSWTGLDKTQSNLCESQLALILCGLLAHHEISVLVNSGFTFTVTSQFQFSKVGVTSHGSSQKLALQRTN